MDELSDMLALLVAIRRWSASAAKAAELIEKMREEGRDTLTDEERQDLQAADDEGRKALVDAIEQTSTA